eukprot:9139069-Pyramimonas_sp.AAC.1
MFGLCGRRSVSLESPLMCLGPHSNLRAVSASPAAHQTGHRVGKGILRLSRCPVGIMLGHGVISVSFRGNRRWPGARETVAGATYDNGWYDEGYLFQREQ